MIKYRENLPQQRDTLFATDGGLETTLIFQEGIPLPHFAAFSLLQDDAGIARLAAYYERYVRIARAHDIGVVLESPTWRANCDWGAKLGYDAIALEGVNRRAMDLLLALRAQWESVHTPIVISGNVGPRGDGYRPAFTMSAQEAQSYHQPQIESFARTDCDMVSAFTLSYGEEAMGIAASARACGLPVAISFTLETDGNLPSGETLASAIDRTDQATDGYPAYYMINCAHPLHFQQVLADGGHWLQRIRGLRANASRCSHAELDGSAELDMGDPMELGGQYRNLRQLLPRLAVVGGCCGTDHRHVAAICDALLAQ